MHIHCNAIQYSLHTTVYMLWNCSRNQFWPWEIYIGLKNPLLTFKFSKFLQTGLIVFTLLHIWLQGLQNPSNLARICNRFLKLYRGRCCKYPSLFLSEYLIKSINWVRYVLQGLYSNPQNAFGLSHCWNTSIRKVTFSCIFPNQMVKMVHRTHSVVTKYLHNTIILSVLDTFVVHTRRFDLLNQNRLATMHFS